MPMKLYTIAEISKESHVPEDVIQCAINALPISKEIPSYEESARDFMDGRTKKQWYSLDDVMPVVTSYIEKRTEEALHSYQVWQQYLRNFDEFRTADRMKGD